MSFNLRNISSLFLTGLVLLLSSGLTVYMRYCDDGCYSKISLVEEEIHCDKVEVVEETVSSCCSKPEVKKVVQSKSCCATDSSEDQKEQKSKKRKGCCNSESFSLDADFYVSFHKTVQIPQDFQVSDVFSYVAKLKTIESLKSEFCDLPPPELRQSGRHIILKKNSFLI